MKNILSFLIAAMLLLTINFSANAEDDPAHDFFSEVDRVPLILGTEIFASIAYVKPIPDGFVLVINESAYGQKFSLIKISKKGEFICKFDKRGNGPGELGIISSIAVSKNSVFAAEGNSPFVHQYSHNLVFQKDYRVKLPGKIFMLGQYIGSWSLNFKKEDGKDITYLLALYDKDTFEFKKVSFEMSEIPPYVFSWGGICMIDDNTFAGVYCNQYQVFLFDNEFNMKKKLLKHVPAYIKEYYPSKQDPNTMDQSSVKWMNSWSKMHSVFNLNGKLIIKYMHNKKRFLDIITLEGQTLVANFEESKNSALFFTEGDFLWRLEWDDDRENYALVKVKLNLK